TAPWVSLPNLPSTDIEAPCTLSADWSCSTDEPCEPHRSFSAVETDVACAGAGAAGAAVCTAAVGAAGETAGAACAGPASRAEPMTTVPSTAAPLVPRSARPAVPVRVTGRPTAR